MKLAAINGLALILVLPWLREPVSFDGAHTYLPLARRLLEQGIGFFSSADSVKVAPLAYLFPALFAGEESLVRYAGIASYLATIVVAFQALTVAHSRQAGWIAALGLAVSPALHPFMADVVTEPTFIFLVGVWALAVAYVGEDGESRPVTIVLGSVALALAALDRPAIFLFIPVAALFFVARWRLGRGRDKVDGRLALMHALAGIPVAAWILKNYVAFGLLSVATGSGAALWLGSDPAVNGFDPVYYGLSYDDGGVARDISHLSIEGDRLLRGAARMQLSETPTPVILEMSLRKAWAFLAMSPLDIARNLAVQRAFRVVLLIFAVAGLAWNPRSRMTIALGLLVAYMTAVHAPVMYHHRYSVGAIELPLILLAGVGIAEAARRRKAAFIIFIAIIAVGAALLEIFDPAPGSPRVDRGPFVTLWQRRVKDMPDIEARDALRQDATHFMVGGDSALEIPIDLSPENAGDYTVTVLRMAIRDDKGRVPCASLTLRYRYAADPGFADNRTVRVPLSSGQLRDVSVGTTEPLHLDRPGVLRIDFECHTAATLELESIMILAPRRAKVYRQKWLDHLAKGVR